MKFSKKIPAGAGFKLFRRLTAVKVMKIKERLDSRLTKWQRAFL